MHAPVRHVSDMGPRISCDCPRVPHPFLDFGKGWGTISLHRAPSCLASKSIAWRQDIGHGCQRLHGAARAARQVENQRPPIHAAYAPAQYGGGRRLQPIGAHLLRDAVDQLRAHGARRLRRDIASRRCRCRPWSRPVAPWTHKAFKDSSIKSCTSETMPVDTTSNPRTRSSSATAGPERSSRVPSVTESLTVNTAAVIIVSLLIQTWCAGNRRSCRPTCAPARLRESRCLYPAPCTCHTLSELPPKPRPALPFPRR